MDTSLPNVASGCSIFTTGSNPKALSRSLFIGIAFGCKYIYIMSGKSQHWKKVSNLSSNNSSPHL